MFQDIPELTIVAVMPHRLGRKQMRTHFGNSIDCYSEVITKYTSTISRLAIPNSLVDQEFILPTANATRTFVPTNHYHRRPSDWQLNLLNNGLPSTLRCLYEAGLSWTSWIHSFSCSTGVNQEDYRLEYGYTELVYFLIREDPNEA